MLPDVTQIADDAKNRLKLLMDPDPQETEILHYFVLQRKSESGGNQNFSQGV